MKHEIDVDFVSDISCPWCFIGLRGLEDALVRVSDVLVAKVHFQPFELNPGVPSDGLNLLDYAREKYGATVEHAAAIQENIRARGASVGAVINYSPDTRVYNTFDAHRLLAWAEQEGQQLPLKRRLFELYFTEGHSPADHRVLVGAAEHVGLDAVVAQEVLETRLYASEVQSAERLWQSRGVNSVPAMFVNGKFEIAGGQPPASYEQMLRKIATHLAGRG